MSETAPERRPRGGGGIGGALKEKMGPLPVWGWLGILTGLALGYWLYERHKAGGASAAAQSPIQAGTAQVPETVVQNTVNVPGAPAMPAPDHDKHKRHKKDPDPDPDKGKKKKKATTHAGMKTTSVNPGGPVKVAVPPQGTTPSLNDVAAQFGTTPQAVANTTGTGSQFGQAWNNYAAGGDFSVPLPAGTAVDVPAAAPSPAMPADTIAPAAHASAGPAAKPPKGKKKR